MMNTDPETNGVAFEVKSLLKRKIHTEQVPTRAPDGIQIAWRAVQAKTGARPSQVRQIYSEWGPTAEDQVFIQNTFPKLEEVSYSFDRPADGNWDAALLEATRALEAVEADTIASAMDALPRTDDHLLPVLRTYQPEDVISQAMVYRRLGPDLAVFLAHVAPTPRGTVGMMYVTRGSLDDSPAELERLFDISSRNLRKELKVTATQADGETVFVLEHPSGMASSALSLPDFHQQAAEWVETDEVFVAFPDPGCLFVTAPGGEVARKLQETVMASDYWGAVALTPACYHLTPTEIRLVAARPRPE